MRKIEKKGHENLFSRFDTSSYISFWFNVWNTIHSIIDTILMLSFNIFVDRLEVKHFVNFVRNWKRDKSNFAFSESDLCNDWFLLFCLLFLLYVFCFTFCCHVWSIKWLRYDEINQLVMIAHWHETWSSNVVVINIVEIVMNLVVKINQLINQLHVLLNSTEIWLTLPRFMVHPRKSISSK